MKMNLIKIFPILFLLPGILIISACKKEEAKPSDPPPTPEELFYTECGKIPPTVACINGAKMFVPNAFSPNSDGFNDVFFPFGGNGIKEIISFKIYDGLGNLIFQESNLSLGIFYSDPERAWDGKLPDGSIQDGIYNYSFNVTNLLDETVEFEGAVCVRTSLPVNCVENEQHIAWGTQHNGNGDVDFFLPSYEDCE